MPMPTLQRLRLTPAEFTALPEYSCSMPTGTTPGKRWRRLDGAYDRRPNAPPPRWMVGEYGDISPCGKRIAVNWYQPVISLRAGT